MVLVKKHRVRDHGFVQVFTPQKNILFDCCAPLYGRHHRHPSIGAPPKDLRFVMKSVQNVDCLFVTSSESLGCLFVESAVRVYCTRPVYEQILLKYEEYSALSVTYDEEGDPGGDRIVSLAEADIDGFRKRVILVKYSQQTNLDSTVVTPVPAGTFIGWCNYRVAFPSGESLLYLTSYFHKRRFSVGAAAVDSTYVIINRGEVPAEDDLEAFTRFLSGRGAHPAADDATVVIPLPMETLFAEVLLHVLSVLDRTNTPVYVVSPIFQKLQLLINIQSEWLSRDFCTASEPLPLKEYAHLHHIDSFNSELVEGPGIVFCGAFSYGLLGGRRLFGSQVDVAINAGGAESDRRLRFSIKMESTRTEILAGSAAVPIDSDEFFIATAPRHAVIRMNSLLSVVDGLLYVSGKLLNTDASGAGLNTLEIREEKCWLARLLETRRPLLVGGWIVFEQEKIRCRAVGGRRIEYERYGEKRTSTKALARRF